MKGVTCVLNKLVEEHLGSTGHSKADFARALGFQNVGKGVRRIDQFLETGVPNDFLVEHLGEALGLEPEEYQALLEQHREELQAALDADREAEVERRRQAFRPFVFLRTERRIPTQITIAGMTSIPRWRFHRIPDAALADDPRQTVRNIQPMLRQILDEFEGKIPLYGRITGFIVFLDFDDGGRNVALDLSGNVDSWGHSISETGGSVTVSIGNKDLTDFLNWRRPSRP